MPVLVCWLGCHGLRGDRGWQPSVQHLLMPAGDPAFLEGLKREVT